MKELRLPCLVLAAVLALSLMNSAWLTRRCSQWTETLDAIDRCARTEAWDEARAGLEELYSQWQRVQTWLHITIEHKELDAAEALFACCRALAQEEDNVEFRAHLAELRSQLLLLDEMQRLSWGNVL